MRARITRFDSSGTPLGPAAAWPQKLYVRLQDNAGFPLSDARLVGAEVIQLFNDAWATVLGLRHPDGLGQPDAVCWAGAWPFIGALADAAMTNGCVRLERAARDGDDAQWPSGGGLYTLFLRSDRFLRDGFPSDRGKFNRCFREIRFHTAGESI